MGSLLNSLTKTKVVISIILLLLIAISPLASVVKVSALSGSEFQAGRIIDDAKFYSGPTMSIQDIQTFLNAKVPTCDTWGTQPYPGYANRAAYAASRGVSTPFICLKDYVQQTQNRNAESGLCSGFQAGNHSAAQIIYWVAVNCGINPQALLVLLQKEQSLVTDDWPWPIQYRSATGYGCPDTAACDSQYYGFFNQVYNAARQFKKYRRDASQYNYRAGMNNTILWNPQVSCGSSVVYIENHATAALYNYTPYRPNQAALNNLYGLGDACSSYGNRNFWRLFNDWFGSTLGLPDYSCKNGTNVDGQGAGPKVIANTLTPGGNAKLSLTVLNNTGSGCIEVHTWRDGQQGWLTNVATNHNAVAPSDSEVITADLNSDLKSELVFVKYDNTGSGKIELHIWDATYQRWIANIATNHPTITPGTGAVVAADTTGDRIDELHFVKYTDTGSGKIEVHTWRGGYTSWFSNVAALHPQIPLGTGDVIAGNTLGDIREEFHFAKYAGTGSGRVEIHTWAPGFQAWYTNVATNHPVIPPGTAEVMMADQNANLFPEFVLVKYSGTGSGRVEAHTWAPGLNAWISNIATNHPDF